MKRKIIYICILVLVIFCALFYFYKNSTQNSVTTEQVNTSTATANTLHYDSDLGFSFDYPNNMFLEVDPEAPRIFVIPNSYRTDKNPTMTAIVITASPNDPQLTPLEWLEGPDSGANMAKGYGKFNIDGQEAILMGGSAWITVDTPDNKRQLSITTLPPENTSQSLMDEMDIILNSFVFAK